MRWLLVVCATWSLGCAPFLGVEDWGPGSGAPAVGDGGSGGDASRAATDIDGEGGSGPSAASSGTGGCSTVLTVYGVSADVALLPNSPPANCAAGDTPTINYGVSPYINVGVGRAVLRFALDLSTVDAILGGAVAELVLTPAGDCDGEACPFKPGTFLVFPMQNEWREGTMSGANVDGATWCEADPLTGLRWAAGGADSSEDHGALAGSITLSTESVATFALPTLDASRWIDHDHNELSFLVTAADAGVLVIASQEHDSAQGAMLRVSGCAE